MDNEKQGILTLRRKPGEILFLYDTDKIDENGFPTKICEIIYEEKQGNQVKLAFIAEKNVIILREEVIPNWLKSEMD